MLFLSYHITLCDKYNVSDNYNDKFYFKRYTCRKSILIQNVRRPDGHEKTYKYLAHAFKWREEIKKMAKIYLYGFVFDLFVLKALFFSDIFQHLVSLMSRLAHNNIGYIDWSPYVSKVNTNNTQ